MNFFKRIRVKRKNKKCAESFLELLKQLNPEPMISFKLDKSSISTIYSNLPKEDLLKLKIPHNASYEWEPSEAYIFGHISILYCSKKFTIYAKGYGPK